jgi:hypothetical protein
MPAAIVNDFAADLRSDVGVGEVDPLTVLPDAIIGAGVEPHEGCRPRASRIPATTRSDVWRGDVLGRRYCSSRAWRALGEIAVDPCVPGLAADAIELAAHGYGQAVTQIISETLIVLVHGRCVAPRLRAPPWCPRTSARGDLDLWTQL